MAFPQFQKPDIKGKEYLVINRSDNNMAIFGGTLEECTRVYEMWKDLICLEIIKHYKE